ncbi:DUF4159 domain-containing protein [Nisaea acidiphila]|uniref:DUF4159 domain-containing protein n=1 Tax=Nisaea acidiphila TaxID=1862145 RepID=A0A9J7ALK6_9PROT|nr:DUF4159 domain-containing protein [Nisaea acidiphila]UUX48531.1 DUF4159 domain-containing protein [Nisaea acidiphila]
MLSLGPLAFAAPWLLAGLIVLPAIWLLIRITPPAPRTVAFPAIRLLYGLQSPEETPDRTPWWLLLLRLLFATLVILALAQPLIGAKQDLEGDGTVVIVVDNGWASAPGWPDRKAAALDLIERAGRAGREVAVFPTALSESAALERGGLMAPEDARTFVNGLAPQPWASVPAVAAEHIEAASIQRPASIFWLADGVEDAEDAALAERLIRFGGLTIYEGGEPPMALTARIGEGNALTARVTRLGAGAQQIVNIRAAATDGRVLTRAIATFAEGEPAAEVDVELPLELRNELARLELEDLPGAASVALLDESFRRRPVGLVAGSGFAESQPLLEEMFFLDRALAPFSEVSRGTMSDFLERDISVIALPDTGLLPPGEKQRLFDWVEKGGTLIRFAGPRLAAASLENRGLGESELLPVRLRGGDRSLGGVLSWSEPAALAPFEGETPFADLPDYDNVLIYKQVLAEPSIELADRTWASLVDGTPIVTAKAVGDGRIVLFHTTANTDWSDLSLSGAFVEMLRRIVAVSAGVGERAGEGAVPPVETLDGFGELGQPPASARSLSFVKGEAAEVDFEHPPGYYGSELSRTAVNLGPEAAKMQPLATVPAGAERVSYGGGDELDLAPWALTAAVILLLLDFIVTLVMCGLVPGVGNARVRETAAMLLLAAGLAAVPLAASAQSTGFDPSSMSEEDRWIMRAALATRLAYVLTGDPAVDEISRSGLSSLSEVLTQRTAVEPLEPMAVDVEVDELSLFPLLYWPITSAQSELTPNGVARLNLYMRNGGTLFFDTRDRIDSGSGAGPGLQRLRELTRELDVPALAPVPENHVLTKAFYLLESFPGRYEGGKLYVQQGEGDGTSEVSPVIVGSHDWAAAWAKDDAGFYQYAVVPGGELQREMAFRSGVNLVMYMLTGNYKADQVHVPAILERLGQ